MEARPSRAVHDQQIEGAPTHVASHLTVDQVGGTHDRTVARILNITRFLRGAAEERRKRPDKRRPPPDRRVSSAPPGVRTVGADPPPSLSPSPSPSPRAKPPDWFQRRAEGRPTDTFGVREPQRHLSPHRLAPRMTEEERGGGGLCEACYHSRQPPRSTRAPPREPRISWVEIGNERWEKAKRAPHGYIPRQPPPPPPPSVTYRYIGYGPPEPPRYSPKVELPGWVPPWERPPPDRRTHVTVPEARAHLCVGKHASAHELDLALERRVAKISRSELLQPSDKAERCRKLRDAHGVLVAHLAHLADLDDPADRATSPPLLHEASPPPHFAVPLAPPPPPPPPPPAPPSLTYRYIVVPYERKQRRRPPLSYRLPQPPPQPPQPVAADRKKKLKAKDPHYIPPWERQRAVPRVQKEPPKAKPVPRPPPEMARLVEVASLQPQPLSTGLQPLTANLQPYHQPATARSQPATPCSPGAAVVRRDGGGHPPATQGAGLDARRARACGAAGGTVRGNAAQR